jgi:hypothetical protein
MFTIKHVIHVTRLSPPGHPAHAPHPIEKLYEASDVVFCPVAHEMGYLQLRDRDTFIAGLFGGMAYVMNDHGKTVARYDLPEDGREAANPAIAA